MLGSVGCINTRHARVKAATQDSGQARLLETLLVSPLPAILILGLVQRLVVGCVKVAYAIFQAGIHDVQVLVGQR